jgi:hypothetical protein
MRDVVRGYRQRRPVKPPLDAALRARIDKALADCPDLRTVHTAPKWVELAVKAMPPEPPDQPTKDYARDLAALSVAAGIRGRKGLGWSERRILDLLAGLRPDRASR